jgi:hypothetical protein
VIVWREKARAFAVHFLVTLLFAASAAALVFLIWFPDPFQKCWAGRGCSRSWSCAISVSGR